MVQHFLLVSIQHNRKSNALFCCIYDVSGKGIKNLKLGVVCKLKHALGVVGRICDFPKARIFFSFRKFVTKSHFFE